MNDTVITLYAPIGSEDENERGLTILCTENDFDALITGDMSAATILTRSERLDAIPEESHIDAAAAAQEMAKALQDADVHVKLSALRMAVLLGVLAMLVHLLLETGS